MPLENTEILVDFEFLITIVIILMLVKQIVLLKVTQLVSVIESHPACAGDIAQLI